MVTRKQRMFGLGLALMLTVSVVACGNQPTTVLEPIGDPIAAVNEEGCEHLAEGPFVATSATTTPTGAPTVASDHQGYRISLPAAEGTAGQLGYVAFESGEATDYMLFLDKDVNLVVYDANGAEVEIEESETSVPQCTIVKARHTVELGVGLYTFEFSDASASEVILVVEEAEHEDH